MAVRVTCPNPECAAVSKIEEESLGRRGRCKRCGRVFELMLPAVETPSAPSPSSEAALGPNSTPPAPASPLNLPEQFGRYRIMRLLGQGGMGAVYLAHDMKLDRQVALKVPFFGPTDGPEAVLRFEREAKAAATLDHPNLCPVHDVGEIDGIHYLTMPYIEGRPLSAVIGKDQARSEQGAAAVVRKLALAIQVAHEKGIIHRDLKPGNILVSKHRDVVIMDFGLARRDASEDTPLTRTGLALGTALYMAPEQAIGDQALIGPRCDVYSLGVILYEMLTGVRPFEGPWSLVIGLKSVIEPDPPSRHRPDLTPSLDALCRKAIAKKPEDRFASMTEFAEALASFLAASTKDTASTSPNSPDGNDRARRPERLVKQFIANLVTRKPSSIRGEAPSSHSVATPEIASAPPRQSKRMMVFALAGACVLLLGLALALAGGKLSVKTAEGMIVIDNLPDDAIVTVDEKQAITIEVGKDKKLIGIKALPGKRKVQIKLNGTTIDTQDVEVSSAGQTPLHVTFLPSELTKDEKKSESPKGSEPTAKLDGGKPGDGPGRVLIDNGGFVPLFNGKDLDGLTAHPMHPANWRVEGDALVGGPESNNFLFTEKSFSRFRLRLQFQVDPDTAGAIALWALPDDVPLWVFVERTRWAMGAVCLTAKAGGFFAHRITPNPEIRLDGEWNDLEIEMGEKDLSITLNGTRISSEDINAMIHNPAHLVDKLERQTGRIAFQRCWGKGSVRFRNITVQEIGDRKVDEAKGQ